MLLATIEPDVNYVRAHVRLWDTRGDGPLDQALISENVLWSDLPKLWRSWSLTYGGPIYNLCHDGFRLLS